MKDMIYDIVIIFLVSLSRAFSFAWIQSTIPAVYLMIGIAKKLIALMEFPPLSLY